MRGKSTKSSRQRVAKLFSEHLNSFGGGYKNLVVCPTCLNMFNIDKDQHYFSAGHILPEAVGGKDWTFLCRKCNSLFGKKQDKWFGEYLDVICNPKGTFLSAKSKSKYITVNGVEVRAEISLNEIDQGVDVFLPVDNNPPGVIQNLELGDRFELSFKALMLDHLNEIEVGYITAAYLYWFAEIGYNWVFQGSLDIVRKQILDCDASLDGARVVDLDTDRLSEQGIGVLEIDEVLYPCCVVVDKLVIFPVPPTVNASLPKGKVLKPQCEIKFLSLKILRQPYMVFYDGKPAVVPDRLKKSPPIPRGLLNIYSDENKKPQWFVSEMQS